MIGGVGMLSYPGSYWTGSLESLAVESEPISLRDSIHGTAMTARTNAGQHNGGAASVT